MAAGRANLESLAMDAAETRDWLDSLEDLLHSRGHQRVREVLTELQIHAQKRGVALPVTSQTPYVNSIAAERQPPFPGNRELERRIKSIIRWNAMAMVVKANRETEGIGGHISSYASCATLYEVGFNHFFRGPDHPCGGDLIYFQGHSSPGIYSRAFLEGRLNESQLHNFRRDLARTGGTTSYPHPWLMPDFWQFPTVSMGLGPIMAIYQARYARYLDDRGLRPYHGQKVWAFLGDGETDEPETLGAITLASRERLDNLIFVVNCNLQRLDGPVRGNGSIVQELEAVFRGAGWNVIKVLWGSDWDELLERDEDGRLARRMSEVVDGEYQKYAVEGGAYIRKHFWEVDPKLANMVRHMTDDQLWRMNLGGHDPAKVYAAYKAAFECIGRPSVILARTIKGYGLGEAGEGKNITHQQKKLNEAEMLHFRDRLRIPLSDADVQKTPFYRPGPDSPEIAYIHERRRLLGGMLPQRRNAAPPVSLPEDAVFDEFRTGSEGRSVSTTMAFVRVLTKLLKDKRIGKQIVPIVPDEARTFGMEALFRQCGIYSHVGQLYEPVDADQLMYYKEARDGQILEEGINEAGSMSSFIAAGTSHYNQGVVTIPFYIYYSMFGFQRIGDLIWAAADMRCRGFLVGGTAGRTTLNGEGLQHQDGHSHLIAMSVPNLLAYDPAFAYEIAVIVRDGLRRMYAGNEDLFYYLTVGNENYVQPEMPEGVEEGILKGMYLFSKGATRGKKTATKTPPRLLGSGAIVNQVLEAQRILGDQYGIPSDVYSVTSYKQVHRDAIDAERHNMLHPDETPKVAYVNECLPRDGRVVVAASDYMKALPAVLGRWLGDDLVALGTDGFGRSDTRMALRDFFEIDAKHIVLATLHAMAQKKQVPSSLPAQAIRDLQIDPQKDNPWYT
ncbi:MAG: pyruvate dehydrogenase (acetyl-transferring), homodimeric type [Planctomycetes bacterium]|nr:pyruvate dehydrogenase (acetyl-transferring), homodimeric type [Planctomycetota bacterium]